jgi:hypothetical protein
LSEHLQNPKPKLYKEPNYIKKVKKKIIKKHKIKNKLKIKNLQMLLSCEKQYSLPV